MASTNTMATNSNKKTPTSSIPNIALKGTASHLAQQLQVWLLNNDTESDHHRRHRLGRGTSSSARTSTSTTLVVRTPHDWIRSKLSSLSTSSSSTLFISSVNDVKTNFDIFHAILENARKLEEGRDYQLDSQLGYISLNQRLSNDEVLGVAFQYTFDGNVYQVGEFANGGIDATTVSSGVDLEINNNTLILKLLKSNITNVDDPIWDLMMKNIYATGAFQLSEDDFKFNILYSDPTPRNYITPVVQGPGSGWPDETDPNGPLEERILLDVFNLDRLNVYNDVQRGGDGFFDFVPGVTVNTQNGLIIFTKVEPFGEFIFDKFIKFT